MFLSNCTWTVLSHWRQLAVDSCTLIRVARASVSRSQRVETAAVPSSDAAAPKSRATTGSVSQFSLVLVYSAGLLRPVAQSLGAGLIQTGKSRSSFFSVAGVCIRVPVLRASARSHSPHFIRLNWAPSQSFLLSKHQQYLRAVYLHFIYTLYIYIFSKLRGYTWDWIHIILLRQNDHYMLLFADYYISLESSARECFVLVTEFTEKKAAKTPWKTLFRSYKR